MYISCCVVLLLHIEFSFSTTGIEKKVVRVVFKLPRALSLQ